MITERLAMVFDIALENKDYLAIRTEINSLELYSRSLCDFGFGQY